MAPDDSSKEAIMSATFDALCERGYANLTMQSIADEFDKSKSLIHYHYDSKDDLLAAFMDHLLENFVDMVTGCGGQDPVDELRRMAEIVIVGGDDGHDPNDFHTALLGLRAQAPYDEQLREQLARNDERIRGADRRHRPRGTGARTVRRIGRPRGVRRALSLRHRGHPGTRRHPR